MDVTTADWHLISKWRLVIHYLSYKLATFRCKKYNLVLIIPSLGCWHSCHTYLRRINVHCKWASYLSSLHIAVLPLSGKNDDGVKFSPESFIQDNLFNDLSAGIVSITQLFDKRLRFALVNARCFRSLVWK